MCFLKNDLGMVGATGIEPVTPTMSTYAIREMSRKIAHLVCFIELVILDIVPMEISRTL